MNASIVFRLRIFYLTSVESLNLLHYHLDLLSPRVENPLQNKCKRIGTFSETLEELVKVY